MGYTGRDLIFFLISIFCLNGVVILTVGGTTLSELQDYEYFIDDKLLIILAKIFIAAGSLAFVVAILRIVSFFLPIKQVIPFLLLFAVITIILELTVGIGALYYNANRGFDLEYYMLDILRRANEGLPIAIAAWNLLQEKLNCCGVHDSSDWTTNATMCGINLTGCYTPLDELIFNKSIGLIATAFVFVGIEVIVFIGTIIFIRRRGTANKPN